MHTHLRLAPGRTPQRRWLSLAVMLAIVCVATPSALSDNWPAWRSDGQGVSAESGLPHEWGPDSHILWSTPLEGDGLSSPIVWEDRVYVTSAIERDASAMHAVAIAIASGLVALAFVAAAAARQPRQGDTSGQPSVASWWCRVAWRLDRAAAIAWTSILLVGLALCLLQRDLVYRPFQEHLGWLTVRNVTIYGLIAALLWIDMRSWWRLAAAALLVAAMVIFHQLTPPDTYTIALPRHITLTSRVLGPIAAAIAWAVAALLVTRRSRLGEPATPSPVWRGLGPVAVVGLAGGVYVWDPLEIARLRPFLAAVPVLAAIIWFIGAAPRAGRSDIRSVPRLLLGPAAIAGAALFMFWYVTDFQERTSWQRQVSCLDAETGHVRWSRVGFAAPGGRKYPRNSYATPTPVTDGRCVVADFGPGLVCMNLEGEIKWRAMEPKYAGFVRYGAVTSPVIFEDKVIHIYMAERSRAGMTEEEYAQHSYIRALDLESGDEIWRVKPPGSWHSYGTPLIRRSGAQPMLLFVTYTHVVAYDPHNGDELWTHEVPIRYTVSSPVSDDDALYLVGGLLNTGSAIALELAPDGRPASADFTWTLEADHIPQTGTAVVDDGLLYWVSTDGICVCVEGATGEIVWKKRVDGEFWASPVAGDGKVYLPADDGRVTVVETGRTFRELATNTITIDADDEMLTSPAISNGRIFLRTRRRLLCIGTESP